MTPAVSTLEAAIAQILRLEKVLKDGRPQKQVRGFEERSLAKATALTWFSSQRGPIAEVVASIDDVDDAYKSILEASEGAGSRKKYLSTIKTLKGNLVRLRPDCASIPQTPIATADQPPDFSPLISDPAMQKILLARWSECTKCLRADTPLAATVMMDGLLEGILLARINRESVKKSIFTAKAAPKDHSKKVKPLSEWMLKDFIEVVHELDWISVSAKDVGAVLRDYRNYIHPQKQLSHGVHLKPEDAVLFWEISKNITRQIIKSVP